jgi:glycosidase
MTLIATVRGIPQIYYGSEIGMAGDKGKGDGDIRHDFPGGWPGDTNNAFIKVGRTEEQNKFFDFTAKLFNWRKTKTVIHNGKTTHYIPENNVYVYFRYNEKESVMVVINNSDETQTIKTNRFQENIKGYTTGTDNINKQSINITKEIMIEPKSSLILELGNNLYRFE